MSPRLALSFAFLSLGGVAYGQAIPANLPRTAIDVADHPSPTSPLGWRYNKTCSPRENLPPSAGMPATANFVHMSYSDKDNVTGFIPQLEYRSSTDGGFTWGTPKVLHQASVNETFVDDEPWLVCEGRSVFFVFQSDLQDPVNDKFAIWAYGSNDMGKTWQGPLLMSPAFLPPNPTLQATTGTLVAAAGGGRVHVVYEATHTSNSSGNEEPFYSSAGFDQNGKFVTIKTDVRMITAWQPDQFDVDNPYLAVDKNLVAIIWVDDRSGGNEAFMRVSRTSGDAWDAERPVGTRGLPSPDSSKVAVAVPRIYAIYAGGYSGLTQGDNAWLEYSADMGQTWITTDGNGKPILLNSEAKDEIDNYEIAAMGPVVSITWYEESPDNGNATNIGYVRTDTLGGLGFVSQRPKEVNLSAIDGGSDRSLVERIDIKGSVIAISGEEQTGESAVLSWSCDAGTTWQSVIVTDQSREVDDPSCSVSLNGDIIISYLEDFPPGSNTGNKTVVTGVKVPTLEDNTAKGGGVNLTCAEASRGKLAVMLMSATGTAPPIVLTNTGFAVNLAWDTLTTVGLNFSFFFVAVVDSAGTAKFPLIPNIAKLLGQDVYLAAVTLDAAQPFPGALLEFSDPIKQNK